MIDIERPIVDMTGTDLRDIDLSNANLLYVDLRGANLTGADISGAKLSGAALSNANLRNIHGWMYRVRTRALKDRGEVALRYHHAQRPEIRGLAQGQRRWQGHWGAHVRRPSPIN